MCRASAILGTAQTRRGFAKRAAVVLGAPRFSPSYHHPPFDSLPGYARSARNGQVLPADVVP
jgi:hypothetical protein